MDPRKLKKWCDLVCFVIGRLLCKIEIEILQGKKIFPKKIKFFFSKSSKNDFYCIFSMKIDLFQHKNTEIFKIGQEIREFANWLIVQKWPLFEPKMFTVQCH